MQWFAQAPSNIALIKYMGKIDREKNIPTNPSLSYTLNNLLTSVVLEKHSDKKDVWSPLNIPGAQEFLLPQAAQERFLNHLARLKEYFDYSGSFVVRSSNNFPHSSGLASSASSFAALTKCAVLALCELKELPVPSVETQAQLSRLGSGSSCRSFFSPWAFWQGETVKAVNVPYPELIHQVILISQAEKAVSSAKAHQLITTSPAFPTRKNRAEQNLVALLQAFTTQNWADAYTVCWREFQDIHHLFESCENPFSYMTEQTQTALKSLQELWDRENDGPIVTMDAGPNIHLLYRPDQANLALKFKHDYLVNNYDIL